ncbi:insulinase family protein [Candidatus Nomurabacteria bacterium]|nr:insulinase family protein [Candidatus Nomurabacteria bacterium]
MNYKKTVLDNGLRIITVPMKDSQTSIAMVLVEAGSHYEDEKINGLSHFLEHMCFKGTKNRTGHEINSYLDSIGAEANAFTGFEYTGYYAKAHFKKINKILDVVSDIYLNSTFPEKGIEPERGVIIEEINMYEDLPQSQVWYEWVKLLYPNQPAGRSILGPKENIRSFKQKDFIDYYKKHYIAEKTVVIVAGNIDQKEVLRDVKEKFKNIPTGKIVKKDKVKEYQKAPQINVRYKKTDQTHLVLGFRAFDLKNKKNMALKVASVVLGKGFSSRLFKRMRDELGMCYYTRASAEALTDHGYFTVSAGVTNSRVEEAIEVIVDEFKRLRDELISDEEIKKAKDFAIGHTAIGLETSDAIADFYGFQELQHEEIKNPKDKIRKLKEVTSKDVQKVIQEIVKNDRLNLALIGPFKENKKFKKILKV